MEGGLQLPGDTMSASEECKLDGVKVDLVVEDIGVDHPVGVALEE